MRREEDLSSPGWTGEAGWCRLLCHRSKPPPPSYFVFQSHKDPITYRVYFRCSLNKRMQSREGGGKAPLKR